jgi:chemotaxis signal transduction protein
VDAGALVGVSRVGLEGGARPRLVALRVGAATFALLVDEVLGVYEVDAAEVVPLGSAERPVVAGRLELGGSTVTTLKPDAVLAAVQSR